MPAMAGDKARNGCRGVHVATFAVALVPLLLSTGSCTELYPEIHDEETALVLDSGGLGGYFVASGRSLFADERDFKERLVDLLKVTNEGLAPLQPSDVTTEQADADGKLWTAFSKRYVLAHGGEADFVNDRVLINFAIDVDSLQGISLERLQDSLRHLAQVGKTAFAGTGGYHPNTTRRTLEADVCPDFEKVDAKCHGVCKDYQGYVCQNCKCNEAGKRTGTPQCVCILTSSMTVNALLGNTVYAILMLMVGLCVRGSVVKVPALEKPWPNIGGKTFVDGLFDCCADMNVCTMVCCCPAVRQAQTYYWAGWSKSYVKLLLITCLFYAMPSYLNWFTVPFLVFLGRRYIRKSGEMTPDACTDCMCSFCCEPCVLCQDARHVDKCMDYIKKKKMEESGDLIGQAIEAEDMAP